MTATAPAPSAPPAESDFPGRLRWVVNELQGVDQLGCLYAIRCRHYDPASTAKVFLEAEAMTPLDAAANAAHVGASGGNVLKHPALTTDWTPVLSTDLLVGGSLTHTGSYRVWARCYSASAIPQLRFLWDVGDLASPTVNDPIRLPGAANFYMLDLGAIRLDPSPVGTHRWKGAIQAKADTAGDPIEIDCLFLQNLDEYAGKIVAIQNDAASVGVNVLKGAGAGADDSGVGTAAWTNPGNITADDGANATGPTNGATTHYLKSGTHGFAVPVGSTISGIKVEIKRGGPANVAKDNRVRLVRAATVESVGDHADTATPWPTAAAYKAYGGPTDLWGAAWTPADINNAGFGAAVSITNGNVAPFGAFVDHIRITVYYTTSGGFSTSQDAVIYANQSAELRTDGCYRDSSDGVGSGLMVPIGNLPRIPPSGAEGRTVELAVWLSRGNFADLPDGGIDDMSSQIITRGAYLFP